MKSTICKIFLLAFGISACESMNELEVAPARAVVEAIMVVGEPINIHVSKEILFKRDEADSIFDLRGLAITMSDGAESFMLEEESDGIYRSDRLVEIGKTYFFQFDYIGSTISSETLVPTKPIDFSASDTKITIPPFSGGRPPSLGENLDLKWLNTDGSSYLVVVENLEINPTAINTSGFPRPSFRSEPITADNYQVRASQFQYYGRHAVILFKVNADYAALYEEDPGDNSLTIKSPYTNVKNGLGIFTAVNSVTLSIEVLQ